MYNNVLKLENNSIFKCFEGSVRLEKRIISSYKNMYKV